MSKTGREVVQGFYDQVVNEKRLDLWGEYISKNYVSHAAPYIGMGLSTRTSGDKMIVTSITPGSPAEGKLQLDDVIIRVEDQFNKWVTFEQLKTAVMGLGKTGTTIKVRVRRDEGSFDHELTRGLIEGFDISCEVARENTRTFLLEGYPDVRVTVKKIIEEGDTAACYTVTKGTNSGFNREAI